MALSIDGTAPPKDSSSASEARGSTTRASCPSDEGSTVGRAADRGFAGTRRAATTRPSRAPSESRAPAPLGRRGPSGGVRGGDEDRRRSAARAAGCEQAQIVKTLVFIADLADDRLHLVLPVTGGRTRTRSRARPAPRARGRRRRRRSRRPRASRRGASRPSRSRTSSAWSPSGRCWRSRWCGSARVRVATSRRWRRASSSD